MSAITCMLIRPNKAETVALQGCLTSARVTCLSECVWQRSHNGAGVRFVLPTNLASLKNGIASLASFLSDGSLFSKNKPICDYAGWRLQLIKNSLTLFFLGWKKKQLKTGIGNYLSSDVHSLTYLIQHSHKPWFWSLGFQPDQFFFLLARHT